MPKGHTAEMSGLAGQAFVVCACKENAIAVALCVALTDDHVSIAVNLCGIHKALCLNTPKLVCSDCNRKTILCVKHNQYLVD